MQQADIDRIQYSRENFHKIRKGPTGPASLEEDWAHILRTLPNNAKTNEMPKIIDEVVGLRELEFTPEDFEHFDYLFKKGVVAISIDYHPWRYEDKQVIWIIDDDATTILLKELSVELARTQQKISPFYKSYPSPIILCRKHLRNSYLPKFAYLPRYTIKNNLTVEVTAPVIWLKPLVAEVVYESTVFLTDAWKMGRDRFARGRMNDMVDGLIPGLLILLKQNKLVGDVSEIQATFKELFPSHPLRKLQSEMRKPTPDLAMVQEYFTPVIAELKEAVLLSDI